MTRIEFDPITLGEKEFGWWKAHFEGNKEQMLRSLLEHNMLLFGLNQDEAREALLVLAESTRYHDSHDWPKATEAVRNYYRIIKGKTGLNFDPQKAAELEVGWWQIHDELEGTPDKSRLAEKFSELYAEIFSLEPEQLKVAGEIKAQATLEHDLAEDKSTSEPQTEVHWQATEKLLIDFYQELKKVLAH
ncbi:MAG TPA: hypothetical protein VMW04_01950 [Patescibacteria group bacterium]|nr:hypothetical protein [Patescibacteria group bacterium]